MGVVVHRAKRPRFRIEPLSFLLNRSPAKPMQQANGDPSSQKKSSRVVLRAALEASAGRRVSLVNEANSEAAVATSLKAVFHVEVEAYRSESASASALRADIRAEIATMQAPAHESSNALRAELQRAELGMEEQATALRHAEPNMESLNSEAATGVLQSKHAPRSQVTSVPEIAHCWQQWAVGALNSVTSPR